MNRIIQVFIIGAVLVVALRVFKFQQGLSETVLGKARAGIQDRDAQQLVIAMALTVGLGMVAVIAAQAFRKVG